MKTIKRLLIKELRLTASPFTYLFLLMPAIALIPRFPPLIGTLGVCLGIFYSFLDLRRDNDILFLFLLPGPRRHVVIGKYAFVILLECAALLMTITVTLVRMLALCDDSRYESGLMQVNLFFLALVMLLFGLFNAMFVGGFFKDAKSIGKPFAGFLVTAFLVIAAGEGVHRIPGLQPLDAQRGSGLIPQAIVLVVCALLCAGLTMRAYKSSVTRFEKLEFLEIGQ